MCTTCRGVLSLGGCVAALDPKRVLVFEDEKRCLVKARWLFMALTKVKRLRTCASHEAMTIAVGGIFGMLSARLGETSEELRVPDTEPLGGTGQDKVDTPKTPTSLPIEDVLLESEKPLRSHHGWRREGARP
jgi:hypothetical protein